MTTDQSVQTDQREAGSTHDNWAAVTNAFTFDEQQTAKPADDAANNAKNEGSPATAEGTSKPSTDDGSSSEGNTAAVDAKDKPAAGGENKPADEAKPADAKPLVEFSPDDIKLEGIKIEQAKAADGTWLAVAEAEGLTIENDTWDDVKKGILAPVQKELEEARAVSLDKYLTTLKPETAAAIKLAEMGYDQQKYFSDKRNIAGWLALDDASLLRADYELRAEEGYTPETIEAKMELLASEPTKLKLLADEIRIGLRGTDRKIDEQKNYLLQQYETRNKEAAETKRQQETSDFKKALDTAQSFMDIPITPELKERVFKKFAAGGYESILKDPAKLVDAIFYTELGQKYLASIKNTAFETGRDDKTKKMSNIPIVSKTSGQSENTNQNKDNWSAMERSFGYDK